MNRFSKVIALALAATMVIGSSVTAFATEPEEIKTSDSSTGAGTSEGHVEQKATNVVLPTVATDGEDTVSPFRYTMDPEGLIAATSHEKYGDAVIFPETDDTSVYFNNGKKGGEDEDKDYIVYANTSAAQTVTNKSSHAIKLTVTAAVASADTDIPLVEKDAYESADEASLYLGLIVGDEDPVAISSTTAATQTVDIAGTKDNFKIAVTSDKKGYEYRVLTYDEWKEIEANAGKSEDEFKATWKNADFQLEGGVTTGKSITSATTAPEVTVTWSWADPEATPEGPSITTKTATAVDGEDTEIAFVGEASDISDIKYNTTSVKNKTTIEDGKITVLSSWTDAWSSGMERELTVVFADDSTGTFTITKE